MPFSRALELFDYWQTDPPVHELVAAFVGFKSDRAPRASTQQAKGIDPEQAKTFIAGLGGQAMHTDSLPSWMQESLAGLGKPN